MADRAGGDAGLGLAIVLAVAMLGGRGVRATIASTQAMGYVGAGLAGMLTLEWSTLVGLGATVLAFAAVGLAGRTAGWRVAGWTAAGSASLATAAAAGLAADLAARTVAFGVLGAAALCLLGGAALARAPSRSSRLAGAGGRARRRRRGAAVHGRSHRHAAAVCTLWGIALGLRALWPGPTVRTGGGFSPPSRPALSWSPGGCCCRLEVALVEAYTLPLAALALLAGWLAPRTGPS